MAPRKKSAGMSDAHKAALAEGRAQGRAVRRYLEALEAHKPKRGRKRTPDSVKKRLTAIETALTGTFDFVLRKDMQLVTPRAERGDVWITMGFDEDLDDAVKHALRDMITLIGELTGLAASDAYTLCSLAADLRVTQTVDGNKGIHCVIRKDRLPDRGALTQARCA